MQFTIERDDNVMIRVNSCVNKDNEEIKTRKKCAAAGPQEGG